MFDLKTRLSGGNIADFTRAIRARKPDDWDGNIFGLPEMELSGIIISSAREAGFFESGQAPTDSQMHGMSYDERMSCAENVMDLFLKWNQKQIITAEEKKTSSKL